MPSTINADNGVVSGSSGVKTTADTSGVLALQSNGSTALSISTGLVTTLTNPLPVGSGGTGATSLSGITAGSATNLAGGVAGAVPYQSGVGATGFSAAGSSGQVLTSAGSSVPTWTSQSSLAAGTATTATNLAGGAASQIPYQTGSGATSFIANGTSGQVLTSNGASVPTWSTPAPSAGTITAVASGSLANGDKVIVNSDGTVSVASGSYSALTAGTAVQFFASSNDYYATTYHAGTQKVVIAYQTTSGYGAAIVGTVSGTTISFGSPTNFISNIVDYLAITYDSVAQQAVIVYTIRSGPTAACAIVGIVSGTSISFGSQALFNNAEAYYPSAVFDTSAQKFVITFQDITSFLSYPTSIVGTVSGTSISFGSKVVIKSTAADNTVSAFDSTNNKVIVAYRSSSVGYSRVGTVSGTSISFGTEATYEATSSKPMGMAYDANVQKIILVTQYGANNYGYAYVGTVSGTSISYGSSVTFQASPMNPYANVVYDANVKKVVVFDANANALVGTISGTTVSFASPVSYNANTLNLPASPTYDTVNKKVVVANRFSSTNGFYATVINSGVLTTNVTASNYIGISNAAYANGATATIQTVGSVDDAQTGLTAGQGYYLQGTGTLATTPDSPSIFAGTAVSATNLIIKG